MVDFSLPFWKEGLNTIEWKRSAFLEFITPWCLLESATLHGESSVFTQDLRAKILQYILIPFEHEEGDKSFRLPPILDDENNINVVLAFILNIIDQDNPFGANDNVKILLM